MDFFEAQARAKRRTSRLVVLFALAVAGTVAGGYFASIFLLARADRHQAYRQYRADPDLAVPLWQPRVFLAVTTGTLLVVGFAVGRAPAAVRRSQVRRKAPLDGPRGCAFSGICKDP